MWWNSEQVIPSYCLPKKKLFYNFSISLCPPLYEFLIAYISSYDSLDWRHHCVSMKKLVQFTFSGELKFHIHIQTSGNNELVNGCYSYEGLLFAQCFHLSLCTTIKQISLEHYISRLSSLRWKTIYLFKIFWMKLIWINNLLIYFNPICYIHVYIMGECSHLVIWLSLHSEFSSLWHFLLHHEIIIILIVWIKAWKSPVLLTAYW